MPTVPHSLRIPEELDAELEREIHRRGHEHWTEGTLALLEEAVRTSRAPGIAFVEGRGGRRAAVAFSGLEVWEIVATWKAAEENWGRLVEAYPPLSEAQLRAALNYYRLYPGEVEARLEREARWTPERLAEEMPFTRPVETLDSG